MVYLLNRALTALLTRKDLDRNTLRPVGEFWFYPQVNLLYDQIQPTRNACLQCQILKRDRAFLSAFRGVTFLNKPSPVPSLRKVLI